MSDNDRRIPPRRPAVFNLGNEPTAAPPRVEPRAEPSVKPAPGRPRAPVARPAEKIVIDEIDPFIAPDPIDPQSLAEANALTPPPAVAARRGFSFGKLAAGAFGVLISLAIGIWTDGLIRDLFARSDWLGWTAMATVAIFVFAMLVVVGREVLAIMRLSAVQHLKQAAIDALAERKPAKARSVVTQLVALTVDKPETARGRAAIADMEGEIVDGPQLLSFAEAELLAPLDVQARRLILNASKRVSIVTAVSPRAIVDLAYVLYESSRLVRAMATLYGGRPGALGLMRLFRDVIAHLAVTSSIAVGDSLVQQLVGHGVASRLSTRLGEGVINGLMTARIGIAAMDLCRPLPFRAVKRPGIGDFVQDLTRVASREESRVAAASETTR